jgi:hypothetical protein
MSRFLSLIRHVSRHCVCQRLTQASSRPGRKAEPASSEVGELRSRNSDAAGELGLCETAPLAVIFKLKRYGTRRDAVAEIVNP